MPNYYPVYLNLEGRKCVVIGGGEVAEGKLRGLIEAGARITLITPEITPGIQEMVSRGDVHWEAREYRPGDLEGAFLAIAATDDNKVNRAVHQEAESRGILLNVVDVTHLCNFIAPAIVRRGVVTLAISTSGASPALARKLRETFSQSSDLQWADLAPVLSRARMELKRRKAHVHPDRWQEAMDTHLLTLAQQGKDEEAFQLLLSRLLDGVAHSSTESSNGGGAR